MATQAPTGGTETASIGERFKALPDRFVYLGGLAVFLLVSLVVVLIWGSNIGFPVDFQRSLANGVDDAILWTTRNLDFIFDNVSRGVLWFLLRVEFAFKWVPWPVMIVGVALLGLRLAGLKMGVFAAVTLLGVSLIGLWGSAMETLALIVVAVTISIGIAIPLGILVARNDTLDALLRPILDAMQTMPSFVYLVPAVMFFGIGNVPAVFATVIYAVPPAIRLTSLGIRQVSPNIVEAARSFGTTPRQLLWKVQVPMAVPTIMAGINQTTMMALAMVVIASLVGAGGLGEDVNRALGRLEPGKALFGGIGIVVLAIIIDRLTQSAAKERQQALTGGH